jgi:hypothetical protein
VVVVPVGDVEVDVEGEGAEVVSPVTTLQAPINNAARIKTKQAIRRFIMSVSSIRRDAGVGQQGGLLQVPDVTGYLETAVNRPDLAAMEEAVGLVSAAEPR